MSVPFTLTPQPIRVTAASRQPIFLALDISGYDALDLEAVCMIEGTATEAALNVFTGMQTATDDGWVIPGANFSPISGTGQQVARVTVTSGLLQYLRWDVSSLGGASALTFFLRGVARDGGTSVPAGGGSIAPLEVVEVDGAPAIRNENDNEWAGLVSDNGSASAWATGVWARRSTTAADSVVILAVNDVSMLSLGEDGEGGLPTLRTTGDGDVDLGKSDAQYRRTYTREVYARRLIASTSSPPTVSAGAALGTGGSASIVRGGDAAFILRLACGTGTTANGTLATITFGAAYPAKPVIILGPANRNANDKYGDMRPRIYDSDISTTQAIVKIGDTELDASTTYDLAVHVIGTTS
jgi:hypothetical protein